MKSTSNREPKPQVDLESLMNPRFLFTWQTSQLLCSLLHLLLRLKLCWISKQQLRTAGWNVPFGGRFKVREGRIGHLAPNPAPVTYLKHKLLVGGHSFASQIEQLNLTFLYRLMDGTHALPYARQARYHRLMSPGLKF